MAALVDADQMTLVYCGDAHDHRRKRCGLRLTDQFFLSATSVRENWSAEIPIVFIHTQGLGPEDERRMDELGVTRIRAGDWIERAFPLANKLLTGRHFCGTSDILFLDCDTIIHREPLFSAASGFAVAYDCLQSVAPGVLRAFFETVGAPPPTGIPSEKPSYEYYYNDRTDLLPYLNSGVYFLKRELQKSFYSEWERVFRVAFRQFRGSPWEFFLDQLSFSAAIHCLGIAWDLFPKGVNFICIACAPYLIDWPKERIIVEHYAGVTSRPLVFVGQRIDPVRSGIL